MSNKFKELKSLVYKYRDEKEKEIINLKNNQENFKEEMEKNNEIYEKIIENATDQIESFIQKSNLENKIQ